jgi:two-component system, sensor histidine kinase PdtaS
MSGNLGNNSEVHERLRCHQAILVDFARVAADTTDLPRLLDLACQNAARAIGVSHAKAMQYRSDKGDLLVTAGKGWNPGVVGYARFGIDMQSPPGRCYQTRDCVKIADIEGDPNYRVSAVLKEHAIRSVLNAPIAVEGIVWGVIEVDSAEPNRFDDDDERFMLAFALILALAVRHRQAQAERERNGEDLALRLAQTVTLLEEQSHRMRNYFQMILSIIASRAKRAADEQSRNDFKDVMERVTAVALAHDQLTFTPGGQSHVDMSNYLAALCAGLERTSDEPLKIAHDLEPIQVRPDRAVPLGLVLNELLTNAIKYAARGRPDAIIGVRFAAVPDTKEGKLSVRDNGRGIGDPRPGSQGLKLVRSLASQLSGWIDVESSSSGTVVSLTFPLVD